MKACKLVLLIVAVIGLISCDSDAQIMAIIRYANDTQHHIALKDIYAGIEHQEDVEVMPGKYIDIRGSKEWTSHTEASVSDEVKQRMFLSAIPVEITVVWDNEYSIKYTRNNHCDKLLVPELYTYLQSPSAWGLWYYGYTFTEADYEYAKENGTRIEKE